jgi:hypothetical protein
MKKRLFWSLAAVIPLLGVGVWAGVNVNAKAETGAQATSVVNCCDDPSCPPGCSPECPTNCKSDCPPCPLCP